MLFNPNWIPETKADVFSLESLIAWLETMPADGRYNFYKSDQCMLAKWAISIDPEAHDRDSDNSFEYTVNGNLISFAPFKMVANDGNYQWTFGAALTRARAALIGKD